MNQTLHIELFGYFPYILIYYERVNPVRKDGALNPAFSKRKYRLIDSIPAINGAAF